MIRCIAPSAALAVLLVACGGAQDTGSSTTTTEEQPVAAQSSLRVVHGASAGAASVWLGDEALAEGVSQGDATEHMDVLAGSHWFRVTSPSGNDELLRERLTFPADTTHTVFVLGTPPNLTAVVAADDLPDPIAGSAFARFVHGVPGAGSVNLSADGRAYASGLGFGDVSSWYQIPAGGARFQASGAADAELGVNAADGGVYTMIIVDGGDGLDLLVITE